MSSPVLVTGLNYKDPRQEEKYGAMLGSILTADWKQALIARGFGWHVTVGALSTPIVGGGNGTVLDAEQPEMAIAVPTGYACIPLRIAVEVELGIQTTDSHMTEVLIAADRSAIPTAGTSTLESPKNMRSDLNSACPLTVYSAFTADGITPTLDYELDRAQALTDAQGTAATLNVYQLKTVYEPINPPIFTGLAGLYVYFGGDIAASGFVQASFLAVPTSLFSSLS